MSLVQPFEKIRAADEAELNSGTVTLIELIGKDDAAVAQNAFGGSVAMTFPGSQKWSGELLSFSLIQKEEGSGAILSDLAGELYIFKGDPSIAVAATDISAAAAELHLANIDFTNANLKTFTSCGIICVLDKPVPFESLSEIYFAFRSTGATTINSAAGDDETLELNVRIRRDS